MEFELQTPHLAVNDRAPDVILVDHTGVQVQLASLWKDQPLTLFFVRHLG